jgi:hypothetical protein
MNISMHLIAPFLLGIIIALGITIVLLLIKLRRINRQIDKLNAQIEEEISIPQFIQKAIQEPDIFVELDRLKYLRGKKVSPAIIYFFEELADRAEFEMIGRYKERVLFSSELHRSRENIDDGEKVEVIVPGWKYKNEVVRYPLVQRLKKGK